MPIYEYECKKCGRKIELIKKREEKQNIIVCFGCGGIMLLLISTSAFFFRGPLKYRDK